MFSLDNGFVIDKNRTLTVLIDFDELFALPTATMLFSLQRNNPNMKFRIVYAHFEETRLGKYGERLKQQMRARHEWIDLPIPHLLPSTFFRQWSEQVALKLYASFFISETIDMFLHLDGDIIVNGRIDDYIKAAEEANVAFYGTKEELPEPSTRCCGICPMRFYINAGSCFLRPQLIKEIVHTPQDLEKRAMEVERYCSCGEQDLLNILFNESKAYYPDDRFMRFSNPSWIKSESDYSKCCPVVIHFAGKGKPWANAWSPREYSKIFWKYGRKTFGLARYLGWNFKRFAEHVRSGLLP